MHDAQAMMPQPPTSFVQGREPAGPAEDGSPSRRRLIKPGQGPMSKDQYRMALEAQIAEKQAAKQRERAMAAAPPAAGGPVGLPPASTLRRPAPLPLPPQPYRGRPGGAEEAEPTRTSLAMGPGDGRPPSLSKVGGFACLEV
jgi:hypothetical protein